MTELSELYDYPSKNSDLFICSKSEEESDQIRCPICSNLASIIEANFQKNFFSISCKNEHEDLFINFNSFDSFIENVYKNLENVLCNNCKKGKNEKEIFRCDKCYLFFCDECKIKHENKFNHLNFRNINDIDDNFENGTNIKMPTTNEINKEYRNIKDNINICEKISKLFNQWINDLTTKFNNYMTLINNYFFLEKIIVSNLKNNYNKIHSKLNNAFLENYEILYPNKYFINNYIQSLNQKINSCGKSSKERSLIFLKLIQNFDEIDEYFKLNQKPLDLTTKSKSEKLNINTNISTEKKISDMNKIKLDLEEVISFNSFKNDKYLLIGTKKGNLIIYEIPQNFTEEKDKLIFKKNFEICEEELKHICVLNNDIVLISDGNKFIKLIKFDKDILNYTLIQTIDIAYHFHKLLPLELNSQYFCISTDNNNIIIYKENSIDAKEKNFVENKVIRLNTFVQNLMEVNKKYLIACCPNKNKIIFFDIKNNFKETEEIRGINSSNSYYNLLLINENKILVAATKDGFELISLKNLSKIKSIHCKYSIKCLEKINENTIICYNEDKSKQNKMRQFSFNEDNNNFTKISEKIIDDNNDILKLKLINGRIFFINENSELNYLI